MQEINLLQSRDLRHRKDNKTKRTLFYLEITSCFTIGARARGLIKEDGRRREAGPSPRNQGTSDTLWSGSSGGAVRSIEGRWSYCSREAQQRAVQGRSRLCHISFLETALILVCSEAQTREREMHPQQYVFILIIIMFTHKADSKLMMVTEMRFFLCTNSLSTYFNGLVIFANRPCPATIQTPRWLQLPLTTLRRSAGVLRCFLQRRPKAR